MIHIVFSEADGGVLQQAMEMDESLKGEIMIIRDDFSVGPLEDIYSDEGTERRNEWWREVMAAGDPRHIELFDDNQKMRQLADTLRENEEESVWIWAAQNKQDVCGYYWTLYFLKEFQGRINFLYLNNLPFINEKGGVFYPNFLSEIPAKEFLKAKKLARPITLSEFEVDPDEWMKLCQEGKGVRILEGGKKLVQADYDFFDNDLRKFVMPDWQKVPRIIHNYCNKAKHLASESYLMWRLKKLIADGRFDHQGNPERMKDLELKIKAAAPALNEE